MMLYDQVVHLYNYFALNFITHLELVNGNTNYVIENKSQVKQLMTTLQQWRNYGKELIQEETELNLTTYMSSLKD